jgi:hypothetical protein
MADLPPEPWATVRRDPANSERFVVIFEPHFREFLNGVTGDIATTSSNVNSGVNQIATQLAAANASRATADSALSAKIDSGGGGAGATSDADLYSDKTTSGTTWVTLVTNSVEPTGAGFYDFVVGIFADAARLSSGTEFLADWRIVEEETGGGTPVTIASGVFGVVYTFGGEEFPSYSTIFVDDLPAAPIASTYVTQVDLRFEIRRGSGSNDIIAPGLSGSMSVEWAP